MGLYIKKSDNIDVLIIAEGTFPYIKGGVSTWIYQLITGIPDINFGVVFLGSRREDYDEIKYDLPKNLVHLEAHFLFDEVEKPQIEETKISDEDLMYINELHHWFKSSKRFYLPEYIKNLDFYNNKVTLDKFLYSSEAWEFILENYNKNSPDQSFIDYFWTVRNIHIPIWVVAKLAKQIENYKIIHSPSTGYAGFLGALLHFDTGKPFILTEHGIYTRERKIDLLNADWIEDRRTIIQREIGEVEYVRTMWVSFFEGLGRFTYSAADPIISLFDKARDIQISYGAPPEKTKIIPNGVDLKRFEKILNKKDKIPPVISLIGRVVPIKDIKTFIKAIRVVANHIENIQGWIVGPEDEDPDYARECRFLVETLNLEENIKFLGFKEVEDVLSETGIVTLTSISEGMPLVIIEGFAAGIPAVTTDVGSCRQLIYGGIDKEDINIGKAGEVVPIANPTALAEAYLKILTDRDLYRKYKSSAIERVKKYYTIENFIESYRGIYKEALSKWQELVLS